MEKTLQEMIEYFFKLYGRRNRFFLPGLEKRVGFLTLGICDTQEAIRKDYGLEIIGASLARVVARIFCVIEHFSDLPFTRAMSQKYPSGFCAYCKSFPCICKEKRPDPITELVYGEQLIWSLEQWQQHLKALYGDRNRQKGIENILNRLFKEIGELLSLQMRIPNISLSLDDLEREFSFELADALAWSMAVANFCGVNLQQVVFDRYGNGCWQCHQNPCICANFNFKPMKWE